MSLKGTKTEKNLLTAFAGESQARNRYTYFASQAKKEGYEQISEIFLQTAEQEREHAKWLFRLINKLKQNGDPIMIQADAPTVALVVAALHIVLHPQRGQDADDTVGDADGADVAAPGPPRYQDLEDEQGQHPQEADA